MSRLLAVDELPLPEIVPPGVPVRLWPADSPTVNGTGLGGLTAHEILGGTSLVTAYVR